MKKRLFATACILFAFLFSTAFASDDILIADFEGDTYGEWKVEGEAFGDGPADGTLPSQQTVSGFKGEGLVNTYLNGDGTTGTLTSPEFEIERDNISFLIGGGSHKGTCLHLLIDGEVVDSATGRNMERLISASFDVSKYKGKTARLRIVDEHTGGWGHINVDQIVQTDKKIAAPKKPDQHEKTFTVENRYLVMPISNGSGIKSSIQLFVDGEKVRQYGLKLARNEEEADWYAFFTIENYKGEKARVTAKTTEDGFDLIRQTDKVPGSDNFYEEPYRPQFHFTQKVGWNNDPNGMVYHDGKWHLFFQHNPVSKGWGNMTWGHAVSEDLLHWEQWPNVLFPRTMAKNACFSGGGTVDEKNTAGWGEDALIAAFTDTGCGEAIAYSTDGGRTFTYYEGNPVVKHKGRDPKIIWYEYEKDDKPISEKAKKLGGHWVMVVYDEKHGRNAAFYTSTNLKDWTEQSHLPGYFECTELFELPVDGDEENTRWVVYAADARYATGEFDGKEFTPEHEGKHRVHWGPYYASQTFSNPPKGRRIQIGWVRIGSPGPYNQHFSFPHRLTLHNTDEGIRMFAKPVEEIEELHADTEEAGSQILKADQPVEVPVDTDLLDVRLAVEPGDANQILLQLPGRTVKYDVNAKKLEGTPLEPVDGVIEMQVLLDRLLMEIAGNDGRVFITAKGPGRKPNAEKVAVVAKGGDARLISLEVNEVESIWKEGQGSWWPW